MSGERPPVAVVVALWEGFVKYPRAKLPEINYVSGNSCEGLMDHLQLRAPGPKDFRFIFSKDLTPRLLLHNTKGAGRR